ncbi:MULTISPECIES: tyrosine-type recombinase/integrase [unclassified Psychrobacter]|uniref:tyrosine-type recombinase/integrase n=2 Tax=Psychrobacter TaxID=497 RepID=UPI0015F475E5|nr:MULTISPECIES: tyrosine-type recombinase/integrase [unclassified Psychrobacter]MBA6245435.1 integrase arm-type DNA-binding domain-containing protein [Psychrobacter sp. Urea-trap-18]MBA6284955.1 integrase arm-type DNA-binding domain-containing protein [Psychrobacter sp. Urea-trap-16]MBA6318804.1 integrase arm-type DNA-binding domain-containing protein [Psychrobacter sp. Urea-trap-20]MBA6333117.1 integrase arm-type DNA-binding domain-containing protein [Psychrobacter sp. Urea-trap-19]
MERKAISSDRSISSHKPEDKKYFVAVKNHPKLFLMVRPTETKSWMYRYYPPSNSKQSIISIGIYPSISYARACEVWREYEDLLSKGIDPKFHREEIKKIIISKTKNCFNHFAWEYFDSLDQTQKSNTLIRKKGRLDLICKYIGDEPISDITSPKMLEVLLDIQAKSLNKDGKPTDKAERCAGIASDVFVYAGARGFCTSDPAALIKSQLAKSSYGHRPAVTKPKDLAKLLNAIETIEGDPNTINSLRLLALLFVRNGDLRRMSWADLDLETGRWRLKPLKGQGKVNMVKDMVVPLPRQAVAILSEQQKINGHTEYVFFSQTAKKHQIISDATANKRLKDLGYKDIHCAHGFRATAKTILQEQLKYPLVLVEMALGHTTKDPNGTAYGRFEYIDDRSNMMQKWADYLDALREGRDTAEFRADAQNKSDSTTHLQALIDQLGEDKVLRILQADV